MYLFIYWYSVSLLNSIYLFICLFVYLFIFLFYFSHSCLLHYAFIYLLSFTLMVLFHQLFIYLSQKLYFYFFIAKSFTSFIYSSYNKSTSSFGMMLAVCLVRPCTAALNRFFEKTEAHLPVSFDTDRMCASIEVHRSSSLSPVEEPLSLM